MKENSFKQLYELECKLNTDLIKENNSLKAQLVLMEEEYQKLKEAYEQILDYDGLVE